MESVFKEYFWVVKVFGVAVSTGLAASAIVTQVGTRFALDVASVQAAPGSEGDEDEDGDEPSARGRRPSTFGTFGGGSTNSTLASAKRKVGEEIRARNIFCPTCEPASDAPEGAAVTDSGPPPEMIDGRPVGIQPGESKSALPLKLVAVMEAVNATNSLATIYDADTAIAGLFRVGDAIRPQVYVVGIDPLIVHLRNNAKLEYIAIGEAHKPVSKPSAEPPSRPMPPSPGGPEIPNMGDSINCPTEDTCIVERAFVEQLMSNPAQLAKQARIVPSQRDGEVQGFKFYGIRQGSLPKLLGLKNGDMLTEVNGEEVKSVDQAMSLAMKLRRASNLSVQLVRRGQTVTKEIQIR